MKKIVTIIAIVLAIAVGDLALTYNNFIVNSDYFVKNDFEITQYKHPEKVWNKVFFGNSVVTVNINVLNAKSIFTIIHLAI